MPANVLAKKNWNSADTLLYLGLVPVVVLLVTGAYSVVFFPQLTGWLFFHYFRAFLLILLLTGVTGVVEAQLNKNKIFLGKKIFPHFWGEKNQPKPITEQHSSDGTKWTTYTSFYSKQQKWGNKTFFQAVMLTNENAYSVTYSIVEVLAIASISWLCDRWLLHCPAFEMK